MSDNGFHFARKEAAAVDVVAHLFQFCKKYGASLYPSVEGFHSGFGGGIRLVEHSQFGFAVKADGKCVHHVRVCLFFDNTNVKIIYLLCKYLKHKKKIFQLFQ